MTFQILPLDPAPFAALHGQPDAVLARHGARRVTADATPGYPCRVSLRDAAVGERLLLLNHVHHDVASPYRASHAIFVIEGAEPFRPAPGTVPEVLARRTLSVRAFDAAGDMLAARLTDGGELASTIAALFEQDAVDMLHVHNAAPGCFAARVVRA